MKTRKRAICSMGGCESFIQGRSLCCKHYLRLWRYGRLYRITKDWKGEKRTYNYKYKGYKSIKAMHKKRFGGLRELVIKRDNEECLRCGMSRENHRQRFGRDITVNHIDKKGRYSEIPNNTMENLETLCIRCHASKDAIKHGRYSVLTV